MNSRKLNTNRAYIFAVLLWLMAAMTALALSLAISLRSDMFRSKNIQCAAEADMINYSGLQYALVALKQSSGKMPDAEQFPSKAMRVGDGAFWLIGGDSNEDGEMNFSPVDLGGRLDLNTVSLEILKNLENITDEAACSIIDWRDSDDEPTELGAESDYYLRLRGNSYNAKNSAFDTTLELALVCGVDDEILYGEDTNANGFLDEGEDADRDGRLTPGLSQLGTAFLNWPEISDDSELIDINTANTADLSSYFANYVDASTATQWASQIASENNRRQFSSMLQMAMELGMTAEQFASVEPGLAASVDENTMRINVNAAGSQILSALADLDSSDVAALVTARDSSDGTSLAWLMQTGLDTEKLSQLARLGIVGRSYQYMADVLSVSAGGRIFKRKIYVIDCSGDSPSVLYSRDITELGWPLDKEILSRLRNGENMDEVLTDY